MPGADTACGIRASPLQPLGAILRVEIHNPRRVSGISSSKGEQDNCSAYPHRSPHTGDLSMLVADHCTMFEGSEEEEKKEKDAKGETENKKTNREKVLSKAELLPVFHRRQERTCQRGPLLLVFVLCTWTKNGVTCCDRSDARLAIRV
eukprot:3934725-Rhodomonas_salina.1